MQTGEKTDSYTATIVESFNWLYDVSSTCKCVAWWRHGVTPKHEQYYIMSSCYVYSCYTYINSGIRIFSDVGEHKALTLCTVPCVSNLEDT